jgi:metal transporter CNNM
MADITSGFVGFFASTFLIVIFGEILPQAACKEYPLYIGSRAVPIVKVPHRS